MFKTSLELTPNISSSEPSEISTPAKKKDKKKPKNKASSIPKSAANGSLDGIEERDDEQFEDVHGTVPNSESDNDEDSVSDDEDSVNNRENMKIDSDNDEEEL